MNISLRTCAFLAICPWLCSGLHSQVQIGYDGNGVSSVNWRGWNFVQGGQPEVERADFCSTPGDPVSGNTPSSSQVDPFSGTITRTFGWGTVISSFAASGDTLTMSLQVSNTSQLPLCQLVIRALNLRFPQKPTEDNGGDPMMFHNSGDLSLLQFSFGSGVVVLANEDVVRPLTAGLPGVDGSSYPLKLSTARNPMYPGSYPFIDRPIAPGATDQYTLSLRFGDPGSTSDTLGSDIWDRYRDAHPMVLNWLDRRPIGDIYVASLAGRSGTNPRGYFGDTNVDVFSPQGMDDFRQRVRELARKSVSVLLGMNAQGMIVWDLEGQQFPDALYIGDPVQIGVFSPEMNAVADELFAPVRDAGLRVGVGLRLRQAAFLPDGSVVQLPLTDDQAVQHILDGIRYAQNRWGATLFYIDSNDYFDADIFRRIATAAPDVLIIPEQENLLHYAYTAPYEDARNGVRRCTPAKVRKMYPDALSVINFVDLATYNQHFAETSKCNDIMQFRGTFIDGDIAH